VGRPIFAEREVILCAGAVQSPQLLQLSGVGDADDLSAIGVPVIRDNKGVGANLQDHLDVCVLQDVTQPITGYSQRAGLKKLKVGFDYLTQKKGPGRDNFLQVGAFLKSRPGLEQPDLQFHMVNALVINHGSEDPGRDGVTVHVCQLRPESRGTIKLKSADPWDAPAIDPNYLTEAEDLRAMREGVKLAREVLAQPAFKPYRGAEASPGEMIKADADIDAFIRRAAETIYHPVGTCRMGADEASVVDEELRVRGVAGLRVADASVMPSLISGNTNAPTIMIAEKAADMILGRAPLKRETVELADAD
ncbi:MAG: GMC oxidoreductase, partial [Pseudomonadota bacterium]